MVSIFEVGGLVGQSDGDIEDSYASSSVSGEDVVGGLVGDNRELIANSYARGRVVDAGDKNRSIGELVGINSGTIRSSYATTGDFNLVGFEQIPLGVENSRVLDVSDLSLPRDPGTTASEVYYNWDPDSWDFESNTIYPGVRYTIGNDATNNPACRASDDDTKDLPVCGDTILDQLLGTRGIMLRIKVFLEGPLQ